MLFAAKAAPTFYFYWYPVPQNLVLEWKASTNYKNLCALCASVANFFSLYPYCRPSL